MKQGGSIQVLFDNIKRHVKKLVEEDLFSFDSLNILLGKATGDTVNTAFKNKISMLDKNGQAGSVIYYECALASFVKYKGANIEFSDINVNWLNNYEAFMLKDQKTYATIAMYMRALRTIMNMAKQTGVIKDVQYPFGKGKYVIKESESRELVLSLEQIGQIVKYKCKTPAFEKYRDIWLFSFFCNGANIVDICKIRYGDVDWINNEIAFYRAKTIRTAKKSKR